MPVDKLMLRAMRFDVSVGVLASEREHRQPIEVDVELEVDTSELLRTGDLATGVDFTMVMESVQRVAQSRHFDLVEVLADAVANALVELDHALSARVEVRKYVPYADRASFAGVEVVRRRR